MALSKFVFSKFVFLAQVLPISNKITTTIERIQRGFLWNSNNVKIKHETKSNDFQNGNLKTVAISSKISSLQCSWVKKLSDENFHDWKLVPMHFINNAFGKNFIFHCNLSFKTSVLHQFSTFYANILQSWKRNISYTPSCIRSQFLRFNNYRTIHNNSVHFKEFSSHNINFINQLFTSEGEFKDWNHIKRAFQLTDNLYYKFAQISHKIPKNWKQILRENRAETGSIYLDHHLIGNNLLLSLEKLISKGLYSILISKEKAYPLHSSILILYSQIEI